MNKHVCTIVASSPHPNTSSLMWVFSSFLSPGICFSMQYYFAPLLYGHHPDISHDRTVSALRVWPSVQTCPLPMSLWCARSLVYNPKKTILSHNYQHRNSGFRYWQSILQLGQSSVEYVVWVQRRWMWNITPGSTSGSATRHEQWVALYNYKWSRRVV